MMFPYLLLCFARLLMRLQIISSYFPVLLHLLFYFFECFLYKLGRGKKKKTVQVSFTINFVEGKEVEKPSVAYREQVIILFFVSEL